MTSAEKCSPDFEHNEVAEPEQRHNDANDHPPPPGLRTWIVVAAMCLLNFVMMVALVGPPLVLTTIGESLDLGEKQTWIPNVITLVQAIFAPIFSIASDVFQARKAILVAGCLFAFVGAAIVPGSQGFSRIVGGQLLIGFGLAIAPLAYCVPSEILPRKWRPAAQGVINTFALLGTSAGPLFMGALASSDPVKGWRRFWWIEMALWGLAAVAIVFAYCPSRINPGLEHLAWAQKVGRLDLVGGTLLSAGLALLLVGLNIGGGEFAWNSAVTISLLVSGIVALVVFLAYEYRGTSVGILNHELFRGGAQNGRTYALLLALLFLEGALVFSVVIFYPILTSSLFETRPLYVALRELPFYGAGAVVSMVYGLVSVKTKSIRAPLFVGFLLFGSGLAGLATVQTGQSAVALGTVALVGVGYAGPLTLIIAGVQLCVPHHLIATGTAVLVSSRAIAATMFTAIYSAALNGQLGTLVPRLVRQAALRAGLPSTAVATYIEAIAKRNVTLLMQLPGVTPDIVQAGNDALKHATADSMRIIYIIAASLAVPALILCCLIGDLSTSMNDQIEAPIENTGGK